MSRRRRRTVLVLLGVVLPLAACGIPTDDEPRPLADVTASTEAPTVPEDADATAAVYLVRDTNRLEAVPRGLTSAKSPETVVEALLAQPSDEELEAGRSTSIPLGTTAIEVTQDGDLVAVDLSDEWETLVQPGALLAYAQVVLTLTDLNGIERVRFLVGGKAVKAPTINQGDLDTVTAQDYAGLDPG
ncbi:MAG TPA: GerMN domain-containing protein [Iamia sp.]|jgi:spore germination protein GerM|nr:GerMN domain-containing protein [Iamia sp.]